MSEPQRTPPSGRHSQITAEVVALLHTGRRVAAGLLAGRRGSAVGPDGWAAALQVACDLTRDHSALLQIADDIHRNARHLSTREAIGDYAADALAHETDPVPCALLAGLLVELASHRCPLSPLSGEGS